MGLKTGEIDPKRETSTEGLFEQLKHFDRVYWIANGMEMLERLAYYGLRAIGRIKALLEAFMN
jgi:dipeptide/tripeptide permease